MEQRSDDGVFVAGVLGCDQGDPNGVRDVRYTGNFPVLTVMCHGRRGDSAVDPCRVLHRCDGIRTRIGWSETK